MKKNFDDFQYTKLWETAFNGYERGAGKPWYGCRKFGAKLDGAMVSALAISLRTALHSRRVVFSRHRSKGSGMAGAAGPTDTGFATGDSDEMREQRRPCHSLSLLFCNQCRLPQEISLSPCSSLVFS